VPGANDLAVVEIAFAERAASVGADSIEAAEHAFVIANGIVGTIKANLFEGARRKLGKRFDFEQRHLK